MALLLLAEWDKNGLAAETLKAYGAAQRLGLPMDALLAGNAPKAAREQALRLPGLRALLLAEGGAAEMQAALNHGMAEPMAALLASLAAGYTVFAAAATGYGKNIMPRLAGLLGIAQVSDIIEILSADTFKRPIYAGNAAEIVQTLGAKTVVTIRASAFPAFALAEEPQAEAKSVPLPRDLPLPARFVSERLDSAAEGEPELGAAKTVLSGGRGFGTQEDFKKLLGPLARRLNAAIGASRAAVDMGFAANDRQIGQTGRSVAPDLYIAAAISGAAQHLAGISDARVIAAINKDAEAPIFQAADYGICGDIFDVLPALLKKLG